MRNFERTTSIEIFEDKTQRKF